MTPEQIKALAKQAGSYSPKFAPGVLVFSPLELAEFVRLVRVADYVPLTDEKIDLCMRLPVGCESWSSTQRSRFMARDIERAVRGAP